MDSTIWISELQLALYPRQSRTRDFHVFPTAGIRDNALLMQLDDPEAFYKTNPLINS